MIPIAGRRAEGRIPINPVPEAALKIPNRYITTARFIHPII
jgi:hypothetical protein